MKLSLLLQRCPPGRSVRMLPKAEDIMVQVGMEVVGEAMITTSKVAVEDMREELEEDMETGEAEEAPEGERFREAGEMEVEQGEVVTFRATIQIQEVIRAKEGEEVTEEEEITKEVSRTQATMVEEVTMTLTTKMEAGIRRESGGEEVGGAGEEGVEEQDKEEAGE